MHNETIHRATVLLRPTYTSMGKITATMSGITPLLGRFQNYKEYTGRQVIHDGRELLEVDLVVTRMKR